MNDGEKYTLCPEFMKLAHLVMDGEANSEEEKLFLAHVEGSKDCKTTIWKSKISALSSRKKCGNVRVPDKLVKAIQLKLREITIA